MRRLRNPVKSVLRPLEGRQKVSIFLVFLCLATTRGLAEEKRSEITVTLFGQTCTLSGPVSKGVLENLHGISPEKVPPIPTLAELKGIRNHLSQLKTISPEIDQYKDHLRKRINAKIAFEESLQAAKKKGNPQKSLDEFLVNIKEHVANHQVESFETAVRRNFQDQKKTWSPEFISLLRDRFENVIQPDPEEEFHKAIRLSQIEYTCNFDETNDADDENDEVEDSSANTAPAPAPKTK